MLAMMRASNREVSEFNDNLFIAAHIAMTAARDNPLSMLEAFEIVEHNVGMARKGMAGMQGKMADYAFDQIEEGTRAFLNTILKADGEKLGGYMRREAEIMESVSNFNEQIEAIADEFGFQFNTPNYKLVHETDAFELYQVLPLKAGVEVRKDLKPVILIPPYMLGVHILSFLPFEGKSYSHAFANEGIPTYVRVVKDIMTNEKVQTLTPEQDCEQTRQLCAKAMELNDGKKVTLNGTCQGGYISLMNILSGKLKDVCDALITNVTPVDGTYSDAISGMPTMHHDFITTTLPSGNKVANGYLLSLGMRFVAIDRETPLVKVLDQVSLHRATDLNPGKTPAALFRWLLKERVHLPLAIANMSSHTFQDPIANDGTLPVKLFDQPLNIKNLIELNVYGIATLYEKFTLKKDPPPEGATPMNPMSN